jgi:Mor family transcriptional regulator
MIKDRQEEIISLYEQGRSVIEMAKQFQCSREAVYLCLRKLPAFKALSKKLREKKQRDKCLAIRKEIISGRVFSVQNFSFEKAAKYFDTSPESIHCAVKGTKYDVSQKSKARRDSIIYNLYTEGLTQEELAKIFKLSQARISYILDKFDND